MFETIKETWLSPIKKRRIDKGIEKKAATPMEQQANSNDDFSFTVLTQFADRAYNVEDNIISSEKNKLLSAIDWGVGFRNMIIPIKPIIKFKVNASSKKIYDQRKPKQGIK